MPNFNGNSVTKITPAGVQSTFATGIAGAYGTAFDSAGNLYVSSATTGTIDKITPAGVVSTFVSGLDKPYGLTFDAAGNLLVADSGANTVDSITPAGVVSVIATGLNAPEGIVRANGAIYVSNAANNTVSILTQTVTVPFMVGGTATSGTDFTVTSTSPLTFTPSSTTATISGTLTAATAGTANKTVTFTLGTPTGLAVTPRRFLAAGSACGHAEAKARSSLHPHGNRGATFTRCSSRLLRRSCPLRRVRYSPSSRTARSSSSRLPRCSTRTIDTWSRGTP